MGVMTLDHDRTPGGQRRGGVAAGDREGQWEVGGAEHRDGAQRHETLADVGTWQGGAVGLGGVDAGTVPAAFPQYLGEQSQLAGGAADLAGDSRGRQTTLGDRPSDQRLGDRLDVGRDRFQEPGALFGGGGAVDREGLGGGRRGGVDIGGVTVAVDRFQRLPRRRIKSPDLLAGARDGRPGDDHLSGQLGGKSRSHTSNGMERIHTCPRPFRCPLMQNLDRSVTRGSGDGAVALRQQTQHRTAQFGEIGIGARSVDQGHPVGDPRGLDIGDQTGQTVHSSGITHAIGGPERRKGGADVRRHRDLDVEDHRDVAVVMTQSGSRALRLLQVTSRYPHHRVNTGRQLTPRLICHE